MGARAHIALTWRQRRDENGVRCGRSAAWFGMLGEQEGSSGRGLGLAAGAHHDFFGILRARKVLAHVVGVLRVCVILGLDVVDLELERVR
eukprot:584186-Prymnesium_polylepis.2